MHMNDETQPRELEKPAFRGFDPHAPMHIDRRHLPHWRQDGATYFVTFRLGDSMPRPVLLDWEDEDRTWLRAHGIDGPLSDPKWHSVYDALPEQARELFQRHAARRLHVELDKCHGSCLLRRPEARRVLGGTLEHFNGERWWVGDFVIMPNHVHGLFQPLPVGRTSGLSPGIGGAGAPPYGDVGRSSGLSVESTDSAEHRPTCYELSDILGSVKGFVSTRLTKLGLKTGKLWQQENYDRLVRDQAELSAWRRYIARNPEKARLDENSYTHHRCDWLDAPP